MGIKVGISGKDGKKGVGMDGESSVLSMRCRKTGFDPRAIFLGLVFIAFCHFKTLVTNMNIFVSYPLCLCLDWLGVQLQGVLEVILFWSPALV